MEVKSMFLRFIPSDSPDVVTNVMYMEPAPAEVTYESPSFDLGDNLNSEGLVEVDISTLPGMTTMDGIYNVGVAAVDDRGNKASMTLMNDVPFDFVAPNPVGSLVFSDF